MEYFAFGEIISEHSGFLKITTTKQILGTLEALRAAGICIVGFLASKWEWRYTIRRTLEFRGLGV